MLLPNSLKIKAIFFLVFSPSPKVRWLFLPTFLITPWWLVDVESVKSSSTVVITTKMKESNWTVIVTTMTMTNLLWSKGSFFLNSFFLLLLIWNLKLLISTFFCSGKIHIFGQCSIIPLIIQSSWISFFFSEAF